MAEATTTRQTRVRKPATATAPRKAAAPKAAEVPATAPATAAESERIQIELVHTGTTKSYEKFEAPAEYKGQVVGALYAPLGATAVKVLVLIGPEA